MANYDSTNTGLSKPNPRYVENTKAPVITGTINVEGVEYQTSTWLVKTLESKVSPEDYAYILGALTYMCSLGINCMYSTKIEKREPRDTGYAPAPGTPPVKEVATDVKW